MGKKTNIDDFLDDFLREDLGNLDELKKKTKDKFEPKKSRIPLPSFKSSDNKKDEIVEKINENEFEVIHDNGEEVEDIDNDFYNDDLEEDDLNEISKQAQAILDWEPPAPRSTPEMLENEWITTGWIGFLHVDQILTEAIITGASDVHLTTDQRVSMSRNGDIIRYDGYIIPDNDTMHLLIHEGILSHQEQAEFNRDFEYDGAYTLQYGPYKGTRTRINIGRSFGKYFIVFRIINDFIPALEDLGVEDEIVNWSKYPNGLFLLCGPTGTGKSTTLASVIYNLMVTTRKKIITIEKPIEYIYPDDTPSLVVQREVGGDTRGFYEGLTSAMRQNPDVILLGEVRNTEEVTELLRAAETGHLAISTMHTNSVATTINRIQNLFSGNEQKRIMSTLADTLRGIANQVLIKDKEDGRFAVREILSINDEIKELIVKGDVRGIRQYQIDNKSTMEHKLAEAVKEGRCYEEEARKQVVDINLFNKIIEQ